MGKLAGDAVISASSIIDHVEAVAERTGLTDKEGDLSRLKLAKAALRPKKTARQLLSATAEEIQAHRDRAAAATATETPQQGDG